MQPESGRTVSTWMATADVPKHQRLTKHRQAAVCIVGGGIAGLSTAYLLLKAGRSVIVVDDGPIGGGETQRTTAHLSNVIDDRYQEIIREFGIDKAQLAYEAHSTAIDQIESIVLEENILCDYARVDGFLFEGEQQNAKTLQKELEACQRVGFNGLVWSDDLPFAELATGERRSRSCIRFPNQAQFHPLKYLSGLSTAIKSMGGEVYCKTHVTAITDGYPAVVHTKDGFTITANHVVIATNSPVTNVLTIHTKQAAYRTYVVAGKVPTKHVKRALFWDTENPYHYVRTQPTDDPDFDMLIIGGEDHRTGMKNDAGSRFERLESWARELFPQLQQIEQRWSGQVCETIDGLAFIGRAPGRADNMFVATGDSGQGFTHGTIAGILLRDLIVGIQNPWREVFSPDRKTLGAGLEWLKENASTASQYIKHLSAKELRNADQLPPGEGDVFSNKGVHIAAYNDPQSGLSQCSAVCPHLKAIVSWNSCERSWDCPAHGSRFDAHGQVLNGPSITDMKPVPEDKLLAHPSSDEISSNQGEHFGFPIDDTIDRHQHP